MRCTKGVVAVGRDDGEAGLLVDLDASDEASLDEDPAGSVETWNSIADGPDAVTFGPTAPIASVRPTTGTRTINSLNALDYDGSSDVISGGDFDDLDLGTNSITFFVVFEPDVLSGLHGIWGKSRFASNDGRWSLYWDTGSYYALYQDGVTSHTVSFADTATDPILITVRLERNGSSSSLAIRKDGIEQDSATFTDSATDQDTGDHVYAGAYQSSTGTGVEAGSYFDGLIAQIKHYVVALGTARMEDIESDLMSKWGI